MQPLLKMIFGWICYALSPVIILFIVVIGLYKIVFPKTYFLIPKNIKPYERKK